MSDKSTNARSRVAGQAHELESYEQRTPAQPDVQQIHGPIYREKAEPRDGYQPIPMWLLLPVFALLLWGGWYLGANSWDFRPDHYDGSAALTSLTDDGPPRSTQQLDPMVLGRRVYNSCASCHQMDGQGVAGAYPPLAGAKLVTGDPRILSRILLHGLEGPISVRGNVYNGAMPAWANLSDSEIAAVLTYIRNSWGNAAGEVPSDLVAEVRRSVGIRTTPWSADELDQIAEQLRDSKADKDPSAEGSADAEDRVPGDDAL
jgi:mono/diheme cytochrome c family protein